MKIAFLNLYSGINNRGAESFVHELAKRLAKSHEVVLISGGPVKVLNVKNHVVVGKVVQQQHGFQNYFDNLLKRIFLDPANLAVLSFSLKALAILKREQFDIVIPINGFWQVIICWIAKISTGSKIMITGHSGPGWDERWNLFLSPDVFVATTEPTREWAKKTAFWVNAVTIPYGIDPKEFAVQPVKIDLEKPLCLCPAAAVSYKRVNLAIKAVSKLPKGSLVHLGDGPLVPEIKNDGQLLLGNKRFLSLSVDHANIAKYYAACDVVVLPSSPQENSPVVFLEALASHKPVVTTNTKRNQWLLGAAGIFIDPTDANNFSQAIKEALDHASKINFEEQLERFSWATIVSAYENILTSLLKSNKVMK